MKKKERVRVTPEALALESSAITQFLLDRAVPRENIRVPLQVFFDLYVSWRRLHRMGPPAVSIDGFGRLFPKAYPRKSAHWKPVGHALNCVHGLGLKG